MRIAITLANGYEEYECANVKYTKQALPTQDTLTISHARGLRAIAVSTILDFEIVANDNLDWLKTDGEGGGQ